MRYAATIAMYMRNPSAWLSAALDRLIGRGLPLREQCAFLVVDNGSAITTPIGANHALCRRAYDVVEPFRADLGHDGTQRGLGEEADRLRQAAAQGHGGWCVAGAEVLYPVGRERLRLAALYQHGVACGATEVRMPPGRVSGGLLRAGWALLPDARQLCMERGDRCRPRAVNAGIEAKPRGAQRPHAASTATGSST